MSKSGKRRKQSSRRQRGIGGTIPVPLVTRGGGRRLWADSRDEPDLEKYARTIVDLGLYLAKSEKTIEQHKAEMSQHEVIREQVRRKKPDQSTLGIALPGCECWNCSKRRSGQARGERFPIDPVTVRREPEDDETPEKK